VEELSEKLSISDEQARRVLDLTKRGSASHSAWLMLMYPRLLLARDLLKDDGVIFISIDDNEQGNLRLLCDDVFGEENLICQFVWKSKLGVGGTTETVSSNIEYLLCYGRSKNKVVFRKIEKGHNGRRENLRQWGQAERREDRPSMYYPIVIDSVDVYPILPDGSDGRWRVGREYAGELLQRGELELVKGNNGYEIYRIFDADTSQIPYDTYINGEVGTTARGSLQLKAVGMAKAFNYPKPTDLVSFLVNLCTDGDDIVCDFFAGSATSAHAVMNYNAEHRSRLKFILIQLPESVAQGSEADKQGFKTIDQIGQERIVRAAKALREASPLTADELDLGFKHYTLAEPSQNTLDKLENFDPADNTFVASGLLTEFGKATVLATWLNRDGYGLGAKPEEIDFAGYKGYYIGKHLYLIDEHLPNEAIDAILTKFDTDGGFNPENVALFGYSFL
jgi:type III restriction enzyme/adenine-specific DNA-methyltransferase